MTGAETTAEGRAVIVGADGVAAGAVFGDHVDDVVATTYDDLPSGWDGVGFVGVAAGVGMVAAVAAVLDAVAARRAAGLPVPLVAVEVPADLDALDALRGRLGAADAPDVVAVRRYRDRPCVVLGDLPAAGDPGHDRAWVVDAVLTAGTTAPAARQSHQDDVAHAWELAAAHARSRELEEELARLQATATATAKAKAKAPRKGGRRGGASAAPAPAPGGPRWRRVLVGASGVLGARSRRGRLLTLTAVGVVALLVLVPPTVAAGALAGPAAALLALWGAGLLLVVLAAAAVGAAYAVRGHAAVRGTEAAVREGQRRAQRRADAERTRTAALRRALRQQRSQLTATRSAVGDLARTTPLVVEREGEVVRQQVQATLNLFEMTRPARGVPALGGWAASADLMVEVVERLLDERPATVVETGSGLSTLFLALAVRQHGLATRIVALEHHAHYAAQTRRLLERHGVADLTEVRFAPLARTHVPDHPTPWYDESAVADLTEVGLLLVDGPPKSTGRAARYPAVPLLRPHFSQRCTIVVDDTARKGDRAVAERWADELPDFDLTELPLEKGAIVLTRG